MRWERQEGKEMVQDRLGERAVCESVVCVCKFVYVKVLCVKELYVTKLCAKDCLKEAYVYVTKLCVEELGVKESCVTKLCVKESCVWQSCVWKGCVWQTCVWKGCATKLCLKGICDKIVWKSFVWQSCVWQNCVWKKCATKLCESCVWQSGAFDKSHQSQTSAISATPATQSEGRCHQVPRLPRRVKVDVSKCHSWRKQCGVSSYSAAIFVQVPTWVMHHLHIPHIRSCPGLLRFPAWTGWT